MDRNEKITFSKVRFDQNGKKSQNRSGFYTGVATVQDHRMLSWEMR